MKVIIIILLVVIACLIYKIKMMYDERNDYKMKILRLISNKEDAVEPYQKQISVLEGIIDELRDRLSSIQYEAWRCPYTCKISENADVLESVDEADSKSVAE